MSTFPSTDDASALSDAQRARIKAELVPGEQLLWSARGNPSNQSGCNPVFTTIIAIVFLGVSAALFAYSWGLIGLSQAERSQALGLAAIFGAIGLFLLIILYNTHRSRRKRESLLENPLYALTDRRAILWSVAPGQPDAIEVVSIFRGQATNLNRVEKPDGSGNLVFWLGQVWLLEDSFTMQRPTFAGIENLRQVEDLARRVLFPESAVPPSDVSTEREMS